MKYFLLIFTSLYIQTPAFAQPGWQQQVNTKIDVRLDDRIHFLYGYEEIEYVNNSPDTLRYIYIHLWPNAYKDIYTPFAKQLDLQGQNAFHYSKKKDRGYIDSLQFTVDGRQVNYNTDMAPDIARIDLPTPLLPNSRIKITTPFRVKIPVVFSRMGHTKQAYYISQWFPKPAVYDRKGWHPISYQDQGEFFSDYGSYDVHITLPKNYVVMGTGNFMDESERRWLDSLAALKLPADTLYKHSFPASDATFKTVYFHEDNIHDFAWFADKRYIVRKDTVTSPESDNVVTVWSAFLPTYENTQWNKATDYLKETIKHYGSWVGAYPYKTMKAVLGDMRAGGGMEYPTVTVIDKQATTSFKTVVVHEAGHNWFYGLLGTNERDHAWMDEGVNTFYELKTMRALSKSPDRLDEKLDKLNENLLYYQVAADHTDQAIEQTSANFTKLNYGADVYYKSALMLNWLEKYMGLDTFQQAMHDYYYTWRYKHPYPEDYEAILQKHASKPLSWFFDTILYNNKPIDYKIRRVHKEDDKTIVELKNRTGIAGPAGISIYEKDSLRGRVWTLPFTDTATVTIPSNVNWTKLSISNAVPDDKIANNSYRDHHLFPRFGINVKPFVGLNMSDKDKLFLSPAIGYNYYDGFMLGILLHNLTVPENHFRFALAPMVSLTSGRIVGTGAVGYMWHPDNAFKDILLQTEIKSFDDGQMSLDGSSDTYTRYLKIAPSLTFTFNNYKPLSTVNNILTLKEYNITDEYFYNSNIYTTEPSFKYSRQNTYGLIKYLHENNRTYNPYNFSVEGQIGNDFEKLNIEGNYRLDYHKKNKALYIRGYFGLVNITSYELGYQRYYLHSSYTGQADYLYDETYIDRNNYNNTLSQQVSMREGGFKIPVAAGSIGQSESFLGAINLKADIPVKFLPIRIFADGGITPHLFTSNNEEAHLLYDAGFEVHLYKDIFSVYIPVLMSSDFRDYLRNTFGNKQVFARSLSFSIQLGNITWLNSGAKALRAISN